MDLETLQRTFPVAENPGLDTLDPRWDEITGLVQRGDFVAAGRASEALLKEDVCDIRLLGYFAFGLFAEQGMPSLAATFQGLARLLGEQWEAVGPAAAKPKASQTALGWFFKQLLRKLQREESQQGDAWLEWIGQIDPDGVDEALAALQACVRSVGTALEDGAGPVLDPASKIREWLQAFRRVVYREPAPEAAPEAAAPASAAAPRPRPEGDLVAQGSYHLEVLVRKMTAFERLIDEQKFPRARIVADDIHETIANFDPVLYFPALFRDFLKLLAVHISDLTQFEDARETPDWKALQALYKADLDEFVSL